MLWHLGQTLTFFDEKMLEEYHSHHGDRLHLPFALTVSS